MIYEIRNRRGAVIVPAVEHIEEANPVARQLGAGHVVHRLPDGAVVSWVPGPGPLKRPWRDGPEDPADGCLE